MNKWLAIPALLIIALIVWTATTQITRETILNEVQATSRVETFYNGEVRSTIKKGTQYFITFATTYGVYGIVVDEDNGRFSQLHLIQTLTPSTDEPTPSETPPRMTTAQIRAITTQAYLGEIEALMFYESAEGGYYLVEVDTEEEDVVLQIHAITGKILSVSFQD